MSEERMNDELAALEASLGSLTPAATRVSRDRLMFLAGSASADVSRGRRRIAAWLWPSALAVSLLAAVTFGMLWATGSEPQIVERVVYVPAPPPSGSQDWLGARKAAYLLNDLNRTPLPLRERQDRLEIAIPGSSPDAVASVVVLKPLRQFRP